MKQNPDNHFVPILSNEEELKIPWDTLRTMIRGRSLLDTSGFQVASKQEAVEFLIAYDIDISTQSGQQTGAEIKKEALAYLMDVLLPYHGIDRVPQKIAELSLEELFVAASSWSPTDWPNWPCALLKLCHAAAHTRWGYDTAAHLAAVNIVKDRVQKYLTPLAWIKLCGHPTIHSHPASSK